jgi:hypothetical protein
MKWQTLVHLIRSRIKFQAVGAGGIGAGEIGAGRGREGGGGRDVGAAPLGRGRGAGRGIPATGGSRTGSRSGHPSTRS